MNESTDTSLLVTDYVVVVGFFVVMVAIGFYFAGRMRNVKDYFAGGNRVPWWLSGISYWMSSFSAFAFVAHSALAYRHGFVPVTFWWMSTLAIIVAAWLVAARWRRVATTSPMEFVEKRYSKEVRQVLAWLISVLIILDDATKIMAVGTVIAVSMNYSARDVILWCGLIMLFYTLLGGLWAVLVTDTVQFFVLLASVFVLVPLALNRVNGFGGFVENAPEGFFAFAGGKYTVWYLVAFGILILMTYGTRWSLVQRFYSVPTDADARKVGYLAAGLCVFVAPWMLFPAMAASVFMPGIEDPDQVYGLVCREMLPAGMLGMLIASIFSATMSSLSSDYNAVASVLTTDVYKRLFNRDGTERHYVLVGRAMTLLVGSLTIGSALFLSTLSKDLLLFDIMVAIFALLGPPTALPILAGLLFRRVSNAGAICGMIVGVGVSAVARFMWLPIAGAINSILVAVNFSEITVQNIPETGLMFIGMFSTIGGMILGSLLWPGSPQVRQSVREFLSGLSEKEKTRLPEMQDSSGISPMPIVGLALAALAVVLLISTLATVPVRESTCSLVVGACMLTVGAGLALLPRLLMSVSENISGPQDNTIVEERQND
ncbi:MAG: hypothetical protein JXM70_20900 [Pirellulales bacterium]|nr:hypothetical protein [Pirellulales bacterium]